MEKVCIHNDGMITKKGKPVRGTALKLLGDTIKFGPGFTLGSFFLAMENYPEIKETSDLLEPILEIVRNAPSPEYKTDEIDKLIFYKIIEIKGFPGPPALNIYNTLKGQVKGQVKDLKFFHIETLLGHQLSLGQLKHIVFGDREDMLQYDTHYTLFELVDSIVWELSFNFNPLECSIRR